MPTVSARPLRVRRMGRGRRLGGDLDAARGLPPGAGGHAAGQRPGPAGASPWLFPSLLGPTARRGHARRLPAGDPRRGRVPRLLHGAAPRARVDRQPGDHGLRRRRRCPGGRVPGRGAHAAAGVRRGARDRGRGARRPHVRGGVAARGAAGGAGGRGGGADADRVRGPDAPPRDADPRPRLAAGRDRIAGREQRGGDGHAARGAAVGVAGVPAAARALARLVAVRGRWS